MIKVLFELVQEYYWPSMKPIYDILSKDSNYDLSIKIGPNQKRYAGIILVSQKKKIEEKYKSEGYKITDETSSFDVVVCGDTLKHPEQYGNAFLCNVDHGPCFKTLRYRNLLKQPDTQYIVFAEGPYRVDKLKEHHLDKIERIYDIGLPKLDGFFNGSYKKEDIIKKYNLDTSKKIVLYAPTYKPTSIFQMAPYLPDLLDEFNVIVKLHPYSWSGKYAPHSQHRIFEKLAKEYTNLHLVPKTEHDILPYLFSADTMISEGSSVINEFLSLGRVGIIFDLEDEKLKHSDGQPLLEEKTSEWLKHSFVHISDGKELKKAVQEATHPSSERLRELEKDKNYIYSYTDGKSSLRFKQVIEDLIQARRKYES